MAYYWLIKQLIDTIVNDEKLDDLVQQAIDALIEGKPEDAALICVQLHEIWTKANLTHKAYVNLRDYIVKEAVAESSEAYIKDQLLLVKKHLSTIKNAIQPAGYIH